MYASEPLFFFRGVPVVDVTPLRIPKEERHPDYYYYDIRHSDFGDGEPVTVEPRVFVNHFGTMVTTHPINFSEKDEEHPSLELTEEEVHYIYNHC